MATRGRLAAWPLSDSRQRKGRFTSSTSGSEAVGTAACTRGRSAPATPRDVADRTGAKGPERAATDNMATAAPNAKPVTETTFRPPRRRAEAQAAPGHDVTRRPESAGQEGCASGAGLQAHVKGGASQGLGCGAVLQHRFLAVA